MISLLPRALYPSSKWKIELLNQIEKWERWRATERIEEASICSEEASVEIFELEIEQTHRAW